MEIKKNFKKSLILITFGVLLFVGLLNLNSVFGFLGKLLSFISPVIAALCIAFVLNVLLNALETKVFAFLNKSKRKFVRSIRRPLCLVLTYLLAFGLISLLILVIIPYLIDTVTQLAEKLPSFLTQSREWLQSLIDKYHLPIDQLPEFKVNFTSVINTVKTYFTSYSDKIFGGAVNITASVINGIFDGAFSIVISIYVLAQKEKIGAFVKRCIDNLIPEKATKTIYHIAKQTSDSFSRFIGGQLTEAVILGVLCYIGMLILGLPNALVISVLICVSALVPIIGPTVGVIIGFLLIVITNPLKAVIFVVFYLVLQQLEGNLIYPKVVGKAVGLPGIIVVSAVLVGGNIGGIMGTLISVPLSAVLYTLLKELLDKREVVKKANKNAEKEIVKE